ncbi:hypothetical protein RO3G_07157 [Rhizopus delemar RA 99-880]|uniref:Uncharacterized protein n=1 Tax=Rhizopus delemar (strain RA 99-880 / ATCC MYA-4621 / FGSC 9543 / NRRL 43880) TaxID=246409 RepID=I1C1X2_RHIO9|nr:hypothetical protein RO3G_07157 [Rhizopus delemar RA 99-880]|eukprot:EIE82452.1 hypothetical protein RO3G_07157 [Rhizopus delemar RA 99-880]
MGMPYCPKETWFGRSKDLFVNQGFVSAGFCRGAPLKIITQLHQGKMGWQSIICYTTCDHLSKRNMSRLKSQSSVPHFWSSFRQLTYGLLYFN